MNELNNTTKLVKSILERDERARNSDSFLYLCVIGEIGTDKGIDMNFVPVTAFLLNMSEWGFPPFESVRRTRQKIQATFPELSASDTVKGMRMVNESEFRHYARSDIQ